MTLRSRCLFCFRVVAAVLPAKRLRLSPIVANYKKLSLHCQGAAALLPASSSEAAKVQAVPELINLSVLLQVVAAILPAETAVPADAVAVEAVVAEEGAVPAADAEPSLADASFGGTSDYRIYRIVNLKF